MTLHFPLPTRWLNGAAADGLRVVAGGVHQTHVVLWFCIGFLDGGR